MTLQERLKRLLRDRDERTADLARHLGRPYTTVREWVRHGRLPALPARDMARLERQLARLEKPRKDLAIEAQHMRGSLKTEVGGND